MTILRTGRFVLTPPTFDDVQALAAHWRDPAVREFLWDDQIVETDVVRDVVAESERDHAASGWGGWVIRSVGDGGLVGWCGLRLRPPDGSPASELLVELTYSLAPSSWRTGAAVEAATAVLDHVFVTSLLDAVFAGVDAPNVRSSATLRRLGFVPERQVRLDTGPTQYWRLARDEWPAR